MTHKGKEGDVIDDEEELVAAILSELSASREFDGKRIWNAERALRNVGNSAKPMGSRRKLLSKLCCNSTKLTWNVFFHAYGTDPITFDVYDSDNENKDKKDRSNPTYVVKRGEMLIVPPFCSVDLLGVRKGDASLQSTVFEIGFEICPLGAPFQPSHAQMTCSHRVPRLIVEYSTVKSQSTTKTTTPKSVDNDQYTWENKVYCIPPGTSSSTDQPLCEPRFLPTISVQPAAVVDEEESKLDNAHDLDFDSPYQSP